MMKITIDLNCLSASERAQFECRIVRQGIDRETLALACIQARMRELATCESPRERIEVEHRLFEDVFALNQSSGAN